VIVRLLGDHSLGPGAGGRMKGGRENDRSATVDGRRAQGKKRGMLGFFQLFALQDWGLGGRENKDARGEEPSGGKGKEEKHDTEGEWGKEKPVFAWSIKRVGRRMNQKVREMA